MMRIAALVLLPAFAFLFYRMAATKHSGHAIVREERLVQFPPRLSTQDKEDAVCYAQRYDDLFNAFCNNVASECFVEDLIDHYKGFGQEAGLVWGCMPDLETNALCYAMRYPDLYQAFCNNDVGHCDWLALYVHYRDTGSATNLLWPCRVLSTKPRGLVPAFALPSLSFLEDDASPSLPVINKIHVIVFETSDDERNRPPLTNQMDSGRLPPWLSHEIVGTGIKFNGFGTKWTVILQYILDREFDEGTYLLIVDARDTLLNFLPDREIDGPSTIRRVVEMVHAITKGNHEAVIMGSEAQCCVSALTFVKPGDYFNPDGSRDQRSCASGEVGCIWNGDVRKVVWEDAMILRSREGSPDGLGAADAFLNAGLVAGFPDNIADLLMMADIKGSEDDQAVFTDLFLTHRDRIVLDYDQVMFGNSRWTKPLDQGGCPFQQSIFSDGLYHEESYSVPLILHTPGKHWECYDTLLTSMGLKKVKHVGSKYERDVHRALQYGCQGAFGSVFCWIATAFGSVQEFFAFIIRILSFGIIG